MALGTLATIGLIVGAAGASLAGYGAYSQARAAQEQARFQGRMARNNAIIAGQEAEAAQQRGEVLVQQQRRDIEALKGRQEVGFAARGIDVGSGSALDVLVDTERLGALDIETIRHNADLESRAYEIEADLATAQGRAFDATQANISPLMEGTSTFLTEAARTAFAVAPTPTARPRTRTTPTEPRTSTTPAVRTPSASI